MPKNWFNLGDGQPFERELADQRKGLELVAERVRQPSPPRFVLELGCAEGLIGKWLLEQGAALYEGYDIVPERISAAQRILAAAKARADVAVTDLNYWSRNKFRPQHHIVLCLAIAHKLADPARFLTAAASWCRELLVIRLPGPIISDRRSNFVPCDPVQLLAQDFAPIAFPKGHLDEWMVILERREIPRT